MLWVPQTSPALLECSQSSTSSEGTTVTASGTTHTKGSYAQLIASTGANAIGITLAIHNVGVASTNARMLVDIAIGGAGSEQIIIPNLMAGNAAAWNASSNGGCVYHFPIFIPAGSRISARCQASTASDTCNVVAWLHQGRLSPGQWVGQRVTAYGADTANSSGVAHTPGSTNAYATATQIVSSTANPIRYMQVGIDTGTDTTGTSMRGMYRIGLGATPDYIIQHVPFGESTTVESMDMRVGNQILSRMGFNVPAASDVRLSAMVSGTGEARRWVIYGVD